MKNLDMVNVHLGDLFAIEMLMKKGIKEISEGRTDSGIGDIEVALTIIETYTKINDND